MKHNPGIGAMPDLSLRISVAALVRVVFKHPPNAEWMMALERKATLHAAESGRFVEVVSILRRNDSHSKSSAFSGFDFFLLPDLVHVCLAAGPVKTRPRHYPTETTVSRCAGACPTQEDHPRE